MKEVDTCKDVGLDLPQGVVEHGGKLTKISFSVATDLNNQAPAAMAIETEVRTLMIPCCLLTSARFSRSLREELVLVLEFTSWREAL